MDDSKISRLITQCKSNDIDARVDAITKLQVEFENGAEIPDHDALITALRTCLKTSNQHLTTATVSALPPLLPLLVTRSGLARSLTASPVSPAASTSSAASSVIDVHALRPVLQAFLPPGGVIDRLGDSREKAREKARETLVLLGGFAFRCGAGTSSIMNRSRDGKGPETPLMLFEKHLREHGLASKVWRVREQAVLTLVHLRRAHHLFPIRAYLPALVETLEDTDGGVRECARQSVVELFTGPGVTDAARADLKKEMAKRGVRKGIVDGVLSRVLAGAGGSGGASTPGSMSEAGSENGDAGHKEYVPPSIALMNRSRGTGAQIAGLPRTVSQSSFKEPPRPASRAAGVVSPPPTESTGLAGGSTADVRPVYIASTHDLENEFASMLKYFEGKETEHNWAQREQSVQRVRGMIKGEAHERFTDTFLFGLKNGFINASLKALASLRTTVSANACSLYVELVIALGTNFDPFCETVLSNLLRMASFTKKIIAQQSQSTFITIFSHTSPQPRLVLPMLWNALQDKSVQMRGYVIGHVKAYLEVHCTRSKHVVDATGGADILEKCLKKGLGDPNAGVRESARKLFWVFEGIWPERGGSILDTLDATARKQVERVCPNPEALAGVVVAATPKPKKSSVAAAIAASRAKARAIATAPPSLRHQATSTSHAARAMSPTEMLRRAASPTLSTSNSTGHMRATSPVTRSCPPRSRIVSGTVARSTSAGTMPPAARNRASPGQPPPGSPPSPTPDGAYRRRVSSSQGVPTSSPPSSTSTLRRAMQTALPASPPGSVITFGSPPSRNVRLGVPAALPPQRESLSIAGLHGMAGTEDESLLLATKIPIPEDSDSDMDESVNLLSFSAPYDLYPPVPKSNSQAASLSPKSSSSRPGPSKALSTSTASPPAGIPQPIVEDALRARAEQAESAAERLLELVEPEEDGMHALTLPASLLVRGNGTSQSNPKTVVGSNGVKPLLAPPRTPVSKKSDIMKRAALFQDSPARNGKSTPLLFDMVGERDNATEWWTKRTSLVNTASPFWGQGSADRAQELQDYITALEQSSADIRALQNLALLCMQYPIQEPNSPDVSAFSVPLTPSPMTGSSQSLRSLNTGLWADRKTADRLLSALIMFLDPQRDGELLEYGLIALWEILEHQAPIVEGRESEVFTVLLQVRYCARTTVMQATNMFRDLLTSRVGAVYGLTTLHASLRAFKDEPIPPFSSAEVRDGTYAFGLIAMGKFILRLPAEVLEEELPRLRATLISALTDASGASSLMVREAAAASIIAAQLVLRDEAHLFVLLDGLPDDKKNLLTYLFDKHGSRGSPQAVGASGMEKLAREMRRLDNRTNTPPRSQTTVA